MLTLNIEKREAKSDVPESKIPAVFYGKGVESTSIFVPSSDFKRVWKEAGSSALISLNGVGESRDVLIQDVDVDPVSGKVRHIDFYVIEKGKVMEATVPFEFVGVAPAVKNLGGILVKVMHEIDVEVLPKDLPHNITVDISSLENLDSQIAVKDLTLPQGVKPLADADEVVAAISQATEEVTSESIDISQVEIEKKGKKEEETE